MNRIPANKPQMTKDQVEKILEFKKIDRKKNPVCVVAVRGYFLDSMGDKGKNDRGIFDDAAAVISPSAFTTVNWNTDPSGFRKGMGTGSKKGMASLEPGIWDYKIGPHKGKSPACRQAGNVVVARDGNPPYFDTGIFAINHHWGSNSGGTSSAGCQTAPPSQWPSYINTLVAELKRYDQKVFKYVLITEGERKQILGLDVGAGAESDAQPGQLLKISINGELAAVAKLEITNLEPAINLVKEFEGCVLHAYQDTGGVWTLGYGTIAYSDGTRVKKGDTCTRDQAIAWMMNDIGRTRIPAIQKLVKVPISNNQLCALISFCYNVGVPALAGSTLLKKLNGGSPKLQVADELLKWVKDDGRTLAGLVRRRKAERDLFLTGSITES